MGFPFSDSSRKIDSKQILPQGSRTVIVMLGGGAHGAMAGVPEIKPFSAPERAVSTRKTL